MMHDFGLVNDSILTSLGPPNKIIVTGWWPQEPYDKASLVREICDLLNAVKHHQMNALELLHDPPQGWFVRGSIELVKHDFTRAFKGLPNLAFS